ncbi:ABC transporter permease [Deminuibacter soli]|uniref:ABC transporter permease n=1 Tax=Deminuibacter soli TaxID=2291815 RepID=A0A3E1ND02_9BACT|nr:ABC transporter permease [Deminuibacter soli]RFM25707.1 ABC transporter permease [Deminuibacter soli]
MYQNYLKIAWRNLLKDRQSTMLNLAGLATGLACVLFIYLWVIDELHVDRFYDNSDRLMQLMEKRNYNGKIGVSEESSGLLAAAVARDVPGVQYAVTVIPAGWFPKSTLTEGEHNFNASGQYAGKDYFRVFSLPLLEGQKDQVLASPDRIVISDELAQRLFNTTSNITGKTIQLQHTHTFTVSGVFKRMPANATEQFDYILSLEYFAAQSPWITYWGNTGPHNFVLLKARMQPAAFNKKLADIVTRNTGDSSRSVMATPYADHYLYGKYTDGVRSGGRIEYVRLFSLIALFILLIACINFMNLSTARASRRLKEVGIKKVAGATRTNLVCQFLCESVMLSMLAMGFAFVLVLLLMPQFNHLTGKQITLRLSTGIVLPAVLIAVVTGVLAGSYPAFYLSRFKPVAVLKGKLRTSMGELFARKGLVVFQFTLSVVFIVAVVVVYQQMKYIQSGNLGYNKDNVLVIASDGKLNGNQARFTEALRRIRGVIDAGGTSHNIVGHNFAIGGVQWRGMTADDGNIYFEAAGVDYNLLHTLNIQMAEGRNFSREYGTDSTGIILNEAAVKTMGFKNPLGETVRVSNENKHVVGVVKDFHFESFHEVVKPMFLSLQTGDSAGNFKMMVRVQQGKEAAVIEQIRALYQQVNPGFVFDYHFLDEAFQRQYQAEMQVASLSKYFAALAIIISCLGLFGLAAFTARRRQKEIGIRKVVGATVQQIALLLSVEFLQLVAVAICIAFPLAWWMMSRWLHSFAYQVHMGAGIFIGAGVAVIFITLCTVSVQSIKAAITNPVKSLKSE